jgi:hypothetical protein
VRSVISRLTSWRSRRWLVGALVVPALALRALVPSGFMPMRDEQGRLSLMFCPGEVAVVAAAADPHAHHHHHPGTPGGSHGGSPGHTVCPFALSAGPALAYAADITATPLLRVDLQSAARHVDPLIQTLLRAPSARAPPHPHRI